ncbi:MAG: CDP-diacylglycerol--serine O-phosphatidyltransferase [Proteobacteria bacterium]|nr:CDP-diacylglycerol--serine O-phosphatidyltransferase [Pseudomonadota bacterium]
MTSRKPRHALYLLPNAFTTAALFFGFYAISQSIAGNWETAAIAVIISALLDACDGRVARLTGTESAFGVEYDSLADIVSFGVAPAILIFQWSLYELEKIGFASAFCYCAATALRLARFNTQVGTTDRRFFIGIPSPAAALLLVSYVACADRYLSEISPYIGIFVSLLLAFTMVSGVRFYSFKTINIRTRRPLYSGLLLVISVALIYAFANDLLLILLIALSGYVLVSYSWALWLFIRRWRKNSLRS